MIRADRGSTILFNAGKDTVFTNRDITIDIHQPRETRKTGHSLGGDRRRRDGARPLLRAKGGDRARMRLGRFDPNAGM